ncbi:MAG TPA: PIG-L family deacetylase [Actinomycetota bacterium]|nr:PIG-L family deacetylase [Actinomycetota bacterium]
MTETNTSSLGTILGVWAHPDDETWLMGGLGAEAVRAGRRVVCVSATRGEEGVQDETRWPRAELPQIRTRELEEALAIIGITEHVWFDYPDGACMTASEEEAVRRVAALIEEIQPDTVLTFGPDGMTGHADHQAVSGWTTEAFRRSGKKGARLLYATITPEWVDRFREGFQKLGAMMTDDDVPPSTPESDLELRYMVPPDLMDLKFRALAAQASQTASTIEILGEAWLREEMQLEAYRLGHVA